MRAASAGSGGGRGDSALRCRSGAWRKRNAADGLPAEEAVDPFQNDRRQMLDFERRRAFDPQHQRGGFRRLVADGARPGDLERLAVGGDLGTDDIGPAGNDFGRGKALRLERVAQGGAEQLRKRPGKTARGLAHVEHVMCHRWRHDRSSPIAAAEESRDAGAGRSACLVRPPRRVLPWRARRGERTDPYRVWLSEIMLQQTTVKAVAPYYARFLSRWPTVDALAAASLDDVLRAWAGLGYYARARNLHACAQAVVERHGGQFPDDVDALRALPGIGDYTAAAIAAIAFDGAAVPVDGNVERVVSRLFAVEEAVAGGQARDQDAWRRRCCRRAAPATSRKH